MKLTKAIVYFQVGIDITIKITQVMKFPQLHTVITQVTQVVITQVKTASY